ncbi:unnamed protein product [Medioppia subpectinata]|uniref:RNA helicase n=1 Tax=Medioppia subpectinata TaxID=1979941 RepID=A0A7R9KG81_9ACAR|nr:unnamed protein product [Medioppia subpectinata]CAG2101617.1 unnamed protein product [Medioppia subpectinata]
MENENVRKVVFEGDDNNEQIGRVDSDTKWEEFNLKQNLLKGIYAMGFETPSFIQKKAVPCIASGSNIRAQAQSGTGKTGAFVVGTLERIDDQMAETQCLVIVSTREIAKQIHHNYESIGKYMNVNTILLTGGRNRSDDVKLLNERPNHIIVGTPGRICDLLEDKMIKAEFIRILVLDEADEMCKEGFILQVRSIYDYLNADTLQILFFSATYSSEELKTISNIVENPVEIDLRNDEYTLQGIKQYYVNIGNQFGGKFSIEKKRQELIYKVHTLMHILAGQSLCQIMVFIRRKGDAQDVYSVLDQNKYSCTLISSELSQEKREAVLSNFKTGKKRILVTSDLCKRGVDIQGLSVVICLDVPPIDSKEDFIHRVGRSGRYGRRGVALHIVNDFEFQNLNQISESFGSTLEALPKTFSFKE